MTRTPTVGYERSGALVPTRGRYARAVADLMGLAKFGMKLGLENPQRIGAAMGDPQTAYPTIHVAGTNGKGSVCAAVEAGLRAAGLRTGLTTSPHLVEPAERIRINGAPVSRRTFADVIERTIAAARAALGAEPTFFEVVTAAAFAAFRDARVDVAVVETGLGGRLDATNVLTAPVVTAIASIGFDHMAQLGDTIEQIAWEKACIAKPGVPMVVGPSVSPAARAVIERTVAERGGVIAPLDAYVPADFDPAPYTGYLAENLRTAAAVLGVARARGLPIGDDAIRAVPARFFWPGRMQRVPGAPEFVLEGAHNEQGVRALADTLARLPAAEAHRPRAAVIGMMRDKPPEHMLRPDWLSHFHTIVCTATNMGRALPARELAALVKPLAPRARVVADTRPGAALKRAATAVGPDGVVFVVGSLYLVGEAIARLRAQGRRVPV